MKDKGTKNNKCIRLVSRSSAPRFSKGDISLTEFAGRHICCQASFLGGISNTSRSTVMGFLWTVELEQLQVNVCKRLYNNGWFVWRYRKLWVLQENALSPG